MNKPKKKKKPNAETQMKLLDAQNRTEFKQKLKWICTELGNPLLYDVFTGILFDMLYELRGIAPRVEAAEGHNVPKEILNRLKLGAVHTLRTTQLPLFEGGPEVSGTDYFNIVMPLYSYPDALEIHHELKNHPEKPLLKEVLYKLRDDEKTFGSLTSKLSSQIDILSALSSSTAEYAYHADMDLCRRGKRELKAQIVIKVSVIKAEWKTFGNGNSKRSAVRVGWHWNSGLSWKNYEPSLFGLPGKKPMELYIMQHALNRLHKRIASKYIQTAELDMLFSFAKKKIIPYRKGLFLIEFYTLNYKAGYFLAEPVEGAVLVRTFLFLTHSGTPEGKQLTETTGLGKLDQKYLAFDNLQTLVNSDILSNEEAKEIFRSVGCGGLIELCKTIRETKILWEISDQEIPLAEKFLDYLKINRNDNWIERMKAGEFAGFEPEETAPEAETNSKPCMDAATENNTNITINK